MTATQTFWLSAVLAKIDDYALLEKDWDSYGAEAADRKSLVFARALAIYLSAMEIAEPAVALTSDGHVGFSWDEGWSLDVECLPDGQFSYVMIDINDDGLDGTTRDLGFILRYLKP